MSVRYPKVFVYPSVWALYLLPMVLTYSICTLPLISPVFRFAKKKLLHCEHYLPVICQFLIHFTLLKSSIVHYNLLNFRLKCPTGCHGLNPFHSVNLYYHMMSGSYITPCNKIDKPLVFTDLVTLHNDIHYNSA